jgi:hypothetical protein
MWRGGHESRGRFIAACMQLQVALERAVAVDSDGSLDDVCASNPLIVALVRHMTETAGLPPHASPGLLAERLESANLACLFPLVAWYFGDRERDYQLKGVPVAHEAYEHTCAARAFYMLSFLLYHSSAKWITTVL